MTGDITVLGVDFSGAKADKNTWVTQGVLSGGALTIGSCDATPRAALAELLASLPPDSVAALDFPFSVPKKFADQWMPNARTMPELWEAAAAMEFQDFMALRDRFVAEYGEPLRYGDQHFPECYSCLHKTNPNMVPMTFRGMQMLHGLWKAGCRVPPLIDEGRTGPLLLELMPGAALRAFGLRHKGYKKGRESFKLRRQILDGLASHSGVAIANLGDFDDCCIGNDDCLDSVVAAVAACLWSKSPESFQVPKNGPSAITGRSGVVVRVENELATARLEGWLYAPVLLSPPA